MYYGPAKSTAFLENALKGSDNWNLGSGAIT